jgi:hypothetical protein
MNRSNTKIDGTTPTTNWWFKKWRVHENIFRI